MVFLLKCYGHLDPERGAFAIGTLGLTFGFIQALNADLVADDDVLDLYDLRIRSYLGFAQIFVSFILMIGLIKKNKNQLLPWLVIYFLAIVSSIHSYYGVFSDGVLLNQHLAYGMTVFVLVLTVFDIYSWFCVLGLFLKYVKNDRDSLKVRDSIENPDNFNPSAPTTAV